MRKTQTKARPRYWLRALLQGLLVCAALLLWLFARHNELYLSEEHKLRCALARSLARTAQVIYEVQPENSEWSAADERLYLVRQGDDIGALRTMVTRKGNTVFGTQHNAVRRIKLVDGVGIAPLYAADPAQDDGSGRFTRGVCAVVTTRDDVASVELRHYEYPDFLGAYRAERSENGVFLLEIDITPPPGHSFAREFDLYNDLTRNYFGATAYDKDGNVLVHIPSTSEKEDKHED